MNYSEVVEWWSSKKLTTHEDYITALENFRIIFTCNSSNIEGAKLTYWTTRKVFEGSFISEQRVSAASVFEIRNQMFALDLILKGVVSKKPITIDFIKSLHKIMMYASYDSVRWLKGERPGTFKVNDYCVGMTNEGSYPEEVEDDLEELLDEIKDVKKDDVLLTAAYFHVKFELIHPFADGNGRVGRALLNYFLMLHDHPPIVLYEEDKTTYYMVLEVFSRVGMLSGFIQFLKEQAVKTWNRPKRKYTLEQIKLARKYTANSHSSMSDSEL